MNKIFNKTLISALLFGVIISLNGCGQEDTPTSSYPAKPTIKVTNINISNGGAEITWDVEINNNHPSTVVSIEPWNDSTYFFSFSREYSNEINLDCNTNIASAGKNISCNDITSIKCTRTLMASDYSEFSCDYTIGNNILVPQYKTKLRVPTYSNSTPSKEVLLTLSTRYWYESGQTEVMDDVVYNDESKMYNVYTSGVQQLGL